MHHRYRPLVVALLSVFALATWVMAGLPTFWTLENQPEFLTGEVDGLTIANDGVISLAPATQKPLRVDRPVLLELGLRSRRQSLRRKRQQREGLQDRPRRKDPRSGGHR